MCFTDALRSYKLIFGLAWLLVVLMVAGAVLAGTEVSHVASLIKVDLLRYFLSRKNSTEKHPVSADNYV